MNEKNLNIVNGCENRVGKQTFKPPAMSLLSCIKPVDVFCRLEVQAALFLHTRLNKAIPENAV
jgi:hypothetical protein